MSVDRPGAARPLLRRAAQPALDGTIIDISAASAGWDFVDIAAYRLLPGQGVRRPADDRERLVLPPRRPRHRVVRRPRLRHPGHSVVGVRRARATGRARRPGTRSRARRGDARARRRRVGTRRPGPVDAPHRRGTQILVESRGAGQTSRRIHHLLPPEAEAGRLIAYEVFTPGGNWSSYPPHKHDTENPPIESRLEELYFYRFAKPQGFAFQRVYTPDGSLDESMTPGDGDVVLVPRGYHPGRRAGRLRLLLPQRHGRAHPGLALHHRSRPRVADGLEPGGPAGGTLEEASA